MHGLAMNFKALSTLFIAVIVLVSCQDTIIVENRPDGSATAPPVSGYLKKNVLIEDYTGTWCGNCTRVAWAIEEAKAVSDKVVSVAIHNGNDPYHYADIAPLKNLILPTSQLALPVSRLNRMIVWSFPETSNVQQALDLTGNNTTIGLAMNSTVANGNINLDVKVKCLDNYEGLKLVVYLLEDKLYYNQRNYYSDLYGGVNPIPNFEHNHVLRASLTDITGEAITGTVNGATVTRNFSIPVPANIANPANISFVAFLTKASDNIAINARAAHANENQSFQENP
ncbi:Omp28-related outer membrane protein [Flavobacterium sp. N1719]|uniref:Omp28-related outer membrane protein n=1 Tax=Flavobacterium sp. N1719 TaxID=2885633 RepID=UPI002223EB8C|nr:Omp28-related outer membrane protein [Flavobacterium sp. N1719]